LNWEHTLAHNGRNRGRSRVAQLKAMRKIKAVIESMKQKTTIL